MNPLLKKSAAEFVGVTVFLTAITAAGTDFKTLALALALGLMIIVTGPISGGHLNPVVSLYFYIKREITLGNLLAYVAAQLAGGLVGAHLGGLLSNKTITGFTGNGANLGINYLAGEVVATAGLVWIIATLVNNKQGNVIPFALAAWVFAAANFTVTGAQANPAVTFGLMVQGLAANQGVSLIVAEALGLLVAVVLLMVFAPAKKKAAARKK